MEEQHKELSIAERYYVSLRKAQLKYYLKNKDKICNDLKEKYRQTHPEIKKRGRPRKIPEVNSEKVV